MQAEQVQRKSGQKLATQRRARARGKQQEQQVLHQSGDVSEDEGGVLSEAAADSDTSDGGEGAGGSDSEPHDSDEDSYWGEE